MVVLCGGEGAGEYSSRTNVGAHKYNTARAKDVRSGSPRSSGTNTSKHMHRHTHYMFVLSLTPEMFQQRADWKADANSNEYLMSVTSDTSLKYERCGARASIFNNHNMNLAWFNKLAKCGVTGSHQADTSAAKAEAYQNVRYSVVTRDTSLKK